MSFLMKGDEFQLWNDCPSPQNQIRSTRYSRSYENENLKTGGILYLFSGGPDLTDYFQGEIITLEMFGTNEKLLRKCRTSEIEGSGKFIIPKIQGNALITKEQNATNISTVKTKQIINSTKPTTTTTIPPTTTTIPTTTTLLQTTTKTTMSTTTTTKPTTTTLQQTTTTTIPTTTTQQPTTTTTMPTTTTTIPTTTTLLPNITTTIPITTTLQSTTTTLLANTTTTTPTMTTTIRTTNSTLFPLNATDLELSMNRYEVTLNVSMDTSTISPGFTSNNNSDGRMKIDKWNKGEKGDKGNQGDKGDKGIAGSPGKPGKSEPCPISNCNLLKGEKGSPGIQGQCSTSTCLSIKGEKGDVGPIGPQGERGFMGEQGKSQQIYEDVIRKVVIEQLLIPDVQNLFKREKGEVGQATNCNCESSLTVSPKLRGLPGSPGKDGMGLDRIVNYGYGAIIVKSRDDLDRIGYYLSPGSLVLVINQENGSGMKKDPILMIKVTDNPNIWRQLNAFLGEEQFLPSSNTFKRIPVQKPNPDNILHNQKKLYFILLPEPWRGNIRVSEANHLCQKFAADNSYIGIFQAFLEDQSRNLKSLMPAKYWHSWQIVNKNEETLFFSWSQMFNGYSRKPGVPLLTFEGHDVLDIDPWRSKFMWVGGALDIYQETVPSCRDWTSSSPTDFGMTINLENVLFLNKVIKRPCGNSYYIGCIQVSPYETRNL